MRLLTIDLASKSHRDIGAAVLTAGEQVHAELIDSSLFMVSGDFRPEKLARVLVELAERQHCNWIAIDGPACWKSAANGLIHSRVCDRAMNAPAKVGLPGSVKPAGYKQFVQFSVDLFNFLAEQGYPRFGGVTVSPATKAAIEIFPMVCWPRLGLPSLPAKAKCRSGLTLWVHALGRYVAFSATPSHDQLQAVIGGLAPLWLASGQVHRVEVLGREPLLEDGIWREGFVVVPSKWGHGER